MTNSLPARLLNLGLLIALLCLSGNALAQQRKLTPQFILQTMARNYANCSSYQDTGMVETAYHEATSGRIEKMPFKIYFKRPDLFRFEWIEYSFWKEGRLNVVWSSGKESFTYWQPDTYEKEESLSMAITGASGVSKGSAHTIPSLLLKEVGGFVLTDLTNLLLAGEDEFEGEPCYIIRGKHPSGDPYEIWIGKRDFLVRKVKNQSTYKDYYAIEEELHRNIKINGPIARETFEFKPPIALTTARESKPPTPPSPTDNAAWPEFLSEEGRFKILMPSKPLTQTLTFESQQGQIVHHSFMANREGIMCIVDYADLPKSMADATNIKPIFDASRDEFLKSIEGKLAGETPISLDGYPGREIKIDRRGGEARLRFYMVHSRFYQLAMVRFEFLSKPSGEMEKFFGSFKLTGDEKQVAGLFQKLIGP
jgi:outer membrane lipoprotein-sorting protein